MSNFTCDICDIEFSSKRTLASHQKNPPLACKKLQRKSMNHSETEVIERLKQIRIVSDEISAGQEELKEQLKNLNKRKKEAEKEIELCLLDLSCIEPSKSKTSQSPLSVGGFTCEKYKNYFVYPTPLDSGEKILLNKEKKVVAILRNSEDDEEGIIDDDFSDDETEFIEGLYLSIDK